MLLIKAGGVWILLLALAMANAAVREKLLVPHIGQPLALPVSGLLLSVAVFLVTLAVIPFLGIADSSQAWLVGVIWLVLTVAFEFLFGHFVAGDPWRKLLQAYAIWQGNLWIVVLAVIASAPWLAAKLRGVI